MFLDLDEKTVLEIWLNPGLNLTIFRAEEPRPEGKTTTTNSERVSRISSRPESVKLQCQILKLEQ